MPPLPLRRPIEMGALPGRGGFGRRATGIRHPRAVSAAPVELHYQTGKLVTWALVSAGFVALAVWIETTGSPTHDAHGRYAAMVRLLGPQGTMLVFTAFALGCAALCIAYLRLLASPDRIAARAAPEGLAINGVWGRRTYAWHDLTAVRLAIVRARGREIPFIHIERAEGGPQRVPVNTVEGGRASVEAWIRDMQIYLRC